jgi:hypothetical protein
VQDLADLVAARAHDLKPAVSNGAQIPGMGFEPCIDSEIMLDGAVESQEIIVH